MAAFDTSRPQYGAAPVAGRFSGFFAAIVANIVAWHHARVTRNALHALTDRELEDIGLVRGDIDDVASN